MKCKHVELDVIATCGGNGGWGYCTELQDVACRRVVLLEVMSYNESCNVIILNFRVSCLGCVLH